jgi:enterochelin esterase-like enzyme
VRWRVCLAAPALAALIACERASRPFDPNSPPVGEERTRISEGVRDSYPLMPEDVVGMLTDVRRQIGENARCELVEWLAAPGSGGQEGAVALSKRMVDFCALGIDDLTASIAKKRLQGETFRFDVSGDEVTLLAHSAEPYVDVCCSMQFPMTRLDDSNFWAARRRLGGIDRAMLSLFVVKAERSPIEGILTYRGANAPADPTQVAHSELAGQLLDRELASGALGETRRLNVYLPPGWSRERTWPAVFLADNSASVYAPLVEAMILAGRIEPIVLISAESGDPAVVGIAPTQYGADLRSAEYIRERDGAGDRFDRHMEFFAVELTRYAVEEFAVSARREDHAVAGFSSGGVFALWAGLLHPEVYAFAIPMSPGIAPIAANDLTTGVRARFRFAGGLYEPSFLETAKAAEAVLKLGGYDASGLYLSAGHDPEQWRIVMHAALLEIFPPASPVR